MVCEDPATSGSIIVLSRGIALRKLRRLFGLRIAAIAAVALLIAQLGAMAHVYSHDAGAGAGSAHRSLGGPQTGSLQTGGPQTGTHGFCGDCLNFAPLLSAAGTAVPLPFIEPQGRVLAPHAERSSLVDHSLHLAFRSRAPPATH